MLDRPVFVVLVLEPSAGSLFSSTGRRVFGLEAGCSCAGESLGTAIAFNCEKGEGEGTRDGDPLFELAWRAMFATLDWLVLAVLVLELSAGSLFSSTGRRVFGPEAGVSWVGEVNRSAQRLPAICAKGVDGREKDDDLLGVGERMAMSLRSKRVATLLAGRLRYLEGCVLRRQRGGGGGIVESGSLEGRIARGRDPEMLSRNFLDKGMVFEGSLGGLGAGGFDPDVGG